MLALGLRAKSIVAGRTRWQECHFVSTVRKGRENGCWHSALLLLAQSGIPACGRVLLTSELALPPSVSLFGNTLDDTLQPCDSKSSQLYHD